MLGTSLKACCHLLYNTDQQDLNILLSLIQYLRISITRFLILLHVIGLATVMSILIGPIHPSPNIPQLMCPYLTLSVGSLKFIFQYLT
jgi:hypothetical protein